MSRALVGLGGVALVVANQVEHQPLALGRALGNVGGVTQIARHQFGELLLESMAVVVLVVLAGAGPTASKIATAVLVGLWILFLISMASKKKGAPVHQTLSVNGSAASSQAVAA